MSLPLSPETPCAVRSHAWLESLEGALRAVEPVLTLARTWKGYEVNADVDRIMSLLRKLRAESESDSNKR